MNISNAYMLADFEHYFEFFIRATLQSGNEHQLLLFFQVNCKKRRKQDNNIAKELRMMGHGEHAQTGLTTK
jgi:hypothetical protein